MFGTERRRIPRPCWASEAANAGWRADVVSIVIATVGGLHWELSASREREVCESRQSSLARIVRVGHDRQTHQLTDGRSEVSAVVLDQVNSLCSPRRCRTLRQCDHLGIRGEGIVPECSRFLSAGPDEIERLTRCLITVANTPDSVPEPIDRRSTRRVKTEQDVNTGGKVVSPFGSLVGDVEWPIHTPAPAQQWCVRQLYCRQGEYEPRGCAVTFRAQSFPAFEDFARIAGMAAHRRKHDGSPGFAAGSRQRHSLLAVGGLAHLDRVAARAGSREPRQRDNADPLVSGYLQILASWTQAAIDPSVPQTGDPLCCRAPSDGQCGAPRCGHQWFAWVRG